MSTSGGKAKTDATGRTSGKMKPHGPRGKKGIGGQFIAHRREMRQSIAWALLTGNDKLALERLEEEHMAHGARENGKLHVTYNDFVAAGIRRAAISTSICRLEALGFVVCVDRGRPSRAEFRFPASYLLTYVQGNIPATDDWRAITTNEEAARRISNAMDELEKRTSVLRSKLRSKTDGLKAERKAA